MVKNLCKLNYTFKSNSLILFTTKAKLWIHTHCEGYLRAGWQARPPTGRGGAAGAWSWCLAPSRSPHDKSNNTPLGLYMGSHHPHCTAMSPGLRLEWTWSGRAARQQSVRRPRAPPAPRAPAPPAQPQWRCARIIRPITQPYYWDLFDHAYTWWSETVDPIIIL